MNRPLARNLRPIFLGMTSMVVLAACTTASTVDEASAPATETAAPVRAGVVPQQASDSYYVTASGAVKTRAGADFVPQAKNVILFVGDGMGVSTVTAGRIYAGQQKGLDGESYRLAMESLPYSAFSKTYSHDAQVPDSAATATALVTGVKTLSRTLGLRSGIAYGNCASVEGQSTDSLFEIAENAGLATGIVSTARITHATPASTYAESADRNWEDDAQVGGTDCKDIARQLVEWEAGDGFEIVLGGGRGAFFPSSMTDPESGEPAGQRRDEADLTKAWTDLPGHVYITDKAGFDGVDFASDTRVLGLFEPSHMQYDLDREEDVAGEPSLAELTEAAITRLSQNEDGYVLMVEGGRIDHAHHAVNAARALGDTAALDEAVQTAVDMTDPDDTLIIVTADHSHTMTIAGYPVRGNPILGKVAYGPGGLARADDGKPYTTLGYANGQTACKPGEEDCAREDLTNVDTTDKDFHQQTLVLYGSETHAGEDVPVFARGPGAELVRGTIEQNEIFHVMGLASGLVDYED
ncbi:MAG: alkaline phosphatase [Henriciella sp.]|jgi:alkaline phosphatase|uniref:alkaline phosphatase n=1 Tax=Henriciella sp. TaxID=1968823 RepID=UPI000C103A11|nr:alkaline phosphatase [Henriciella sp.]MAN75039.1 alkaline phosphatase [Henriciella sp.]MBF33764.1 alkaline phosphatase [Hyphomonadaceae bacterium]PHR76443.1 MAG: alkaline phosphatase [Henriciella sp.]|tara:strand:+ start:7112 stop:8683 length:1572 start_codon:yes stop_codon:yes gene_type:complete